MSRNRNPWRWRDIADIEPEVNPKRIEWLLLMLGLAAIGLWAKEAFYR